MFRIIILSFFLMLPIFAQSTNTRVKREIINTSRSVSKSLVKINKLFSKLTTAQRIAVLKSLKTISADSDADGLPNIVEPSGGICDSDLDDDGSSDGHEINSGTDPKDRDSDDDGVEDDEDDHDDSNDD